jgi:diguanylate cyclase (GGDEF)-like protein
MPDTQDKLALVVSHDPLLVADVESLLRAAGTRTVMVGRATRATLGVSPSVDLILIDGDLPPAEINQMLVSAQQEPAILSDSIVLMADGGFERWKRRMTEGLLHDLIPRDRRNPHWHLRLELAQRDAARAENETDPCTVPMNRSALLSALFRETDRVQRMRMPLSLLLCEIDDFEHWSTRLETRTCDALLRAVVERTRPLLRSYDTFGRTGDHTLLAILSGCSVVNAQTLAERMRTAVFSEPVSWRAESVRLSASFGIASSAGRSPLVVLNEAEQAIQKAQEEGPESIRCFVSHAAADIEPVEFLSRSEVPLTIAARATPR